jgi:hypothetical protein
MTVVGDRVFDVATGFVGKTLPAVLYSEAVHRVKAFCTSPRSGWITYDLAGEHARRSGQFTTVGPWSLLYATALAGQITIDNIASFTAARRLQLAELLRAVPPDVALHELAADGVEAVCQLCRFSYAGAWAPKITKVAALYRPAAVPILDGHVARAFGFTHEGFSSYDGAARRDRIGRVVRAIALQVRARHGLLSELRTEIADLVPEIILISDVRLLDIVIWTAQDDQMARPGKPAGQWLARAIGPRTPFEQVGPITI